MGDAGRRWSSSSASSPQWWARIRRSRPARAHRAAPGLLVSGVKPGDEVICPSYIFVATANAVLYAQASPILADIERDTWNLDPADVARRVTPRTKAVIVVHTSSVCPRRLLHEPTSLTRAPFGSALAIRARIAHRARRNAEDDESARTASAAVSQT